ncbi:MAG TPA: two-component regulator propeller domain-containing protein [Bacteroidia bacterium]|jgi:ligand-binding sensor domain-containing protein/serine phosphatase RsbU (regulator of sigma subunit)|nr:two-component regulator propeller domain-containing protein [Bacteroidia bacterium]
MIQKKIIQLVLLFLFPFLLRSQTYPFTNYGVQDGLPQSNVSAITQDKEGYFWLASESGISKFDGKNFINYTTESGLADNNVACLLTDVKGNLWLAHENGSLTKYSNGKFVPVICELLPKDKKIFSLSQNKKGEIWISSAVGAIVILNPEGNLNDKSNYKVYTSQEGLSQYVLSTQQDKTGNMWFLTDVGIKWMDAKTRKFDFFRPEGMPFGQITSFLLDENDNVLLGTSNGLIYKYSNSTKQFEIIFDYHNYINTTSSAVTNNFVYTIFKDSKNNIWASVFNIGLCKIETKRTIVFNTSNGLAINKIKSIAEDNEGNILIGTIGEGLQIFKGERFVSFSKTNGLINSQVWAICQDNNKNYWFGTNEGITIYDPGESQLEKKYKNIPVIEGSQANNVRSIVKDKNGNLWIGIWGGRVVKYTSATQKFSAQPQLFEFVNAYVSCLYIDSKNKLWIGTVDGITVYDLNNESIKSIRAIDGLCDNDVTSIFEDSEGRMWIGTKNKGISFSLGSSFKTINKENGLTYESVTSICEDKKKNIWIGTSGGGVFVYGENIYQKYKVSDGLLSDFITLVTVDEKNNIWLGTNKGLCKFDQAKKQFFSYQKNDGFTGIETKSKAVYTDNEKNIWFGTINGVFKYDPNFDNNSIPEPSLHITNLKINLKDYPVSDKMELSYKDNSLNFDYIGISLSNPDEIKYKIKLVGSDEDWRPETKQTTAVFSNLAPGNYTLQISACNNVGVCNQKPLSIGINIAPPFWKTWWFYVLVIVVGGALVLSYIKVRERALVRENKILEEKVEERTAEVVQKNIELDEINKDITASIRYAKRIQDAILPPDDFVKKYLPKTFILFKPKDIVSGDFYWLDDKKDQVLFAAVDCTGHGVPGAFMSIVGHSKLDQIVGEHGITKPSAILDELNKSVSDTLRQSYIEDNSVKDGMDIALCSFNRKTNAMEYAGAFNPLWLIRKGELIEYKADKFPIGNLKAGENKKFTNHIIPLQEGDTLYIFSDGFADQFGGPNGKKLKYSTFKQLLLDNQHLSMDQQGELLNKTIEEWRGSLEQIDDILVIGTRL